MVLLECANRMQSVMVKHRKHQGHPIVGYEEMMHTHDRDEELVEFTAEANYKLQIDKVETKYIYLKF